MYLGEQSTIKYEVNLLGENNGKKVNITFCPANVDSGIIFERTDLNKKEKINFSNVYIENLGLHTNLIKNIENILVALWACKIDNCLIKIDTDSVPILENGSEPISFLLTTASKKNLGKIRDVYIQKEKLETKNLVINPNVSFGITSNNFKFDNSKQPYKDWIARVNKSDNKYYVVLIIAMLYVSGKFSLLDLEVKDFDEKSIFESIKGIF